MTPRSQAALIASIKSGRRGALPDPNVSRTTPRMGGTTKALTVAAVMPGNKRRVA